MEIYSEYSVNLCILSEYRKIRTRDNSMFGNFSHSNWYCMRQGFFCCWVFCDLKDQPNSHNAYLNTFHYVKSVLIFIRSFSGPYFPAFGLNMERYMGVSLRTQSECEEIRTRKTPNTDTLHTVFGDTFESVHSRSIGNMGPSLLFESSEKTPEHKTLFGINLRFFLSISYEYSE